MSVARRFTSAPMQISPGMTHPPSRLCLSDLRHGVPYKFRALQILACSPRRAASYPLPVRQASVLPSASSRFPVARNTLAVRLTLPLAGRVEDFHLQVSAPCRAHQKKWPADGPFSCPAQVLQTCVGPQRSGLVGGFPGEFRFVTAQVAVH